MKKVKLFIVTYNAPNALHGTLEELFSSDFINSGNEIIIINNHSNFHVDQKFHGRCKVIHNQGRPDFSKGHLSRSWNQTLLHGFQDLNNPQSDIVVHAQDDTAFEKDWFSSLLELHKKYTFISDGVGDNFCSYTVEAVKNIGMWDERFCNIGYQEADYFLRAYIYNRDKSSINDSAHHRVWNALQKPLVNRLNTVWTRERTFDSLPYHKVSLQVFERKWSVTAAFWDQPDFFSKASQIKTPNIPTFMMYPYFEKDINNLTEKGYICLP